ncbi:MAG TPA: type II toxin-antitoxin system HigB family toxin [Blastocatellia bacterium]|nr:type II toxin-antitoxin system HigB family toxin [Blastocatellia bacterium]
MNVISRKKLEEFWQVHPDSEPPLRNWHNTCRKARWKNLDETQKIYPHADPVGDCAVFNIGGNKYRLIAKIRYQYQRIYVIHVLTHKDYDKGKWKDEC